MLVETAACDTEAADEPVVDVATVDDDCPNPPCGIACVNAVSERRAAEAAKKEGSMLRIYLKANRGNA